MSYELCSLVKCLPMQKVSECFKKCCVTQGTLFCRLCISGTAYGCCYCCHVTYSHSDASRPQNTARLGSVQTVFWLLHTKKDWNPFQTLINKYNNHFEECVTNPRTYFGNSYHSLCAFMGNWALVMVQTVIDVLYEGTVDAECWSLAYSHQFNALLWFYY